MNKKNILHLTYDMRIGGTEMVIKSIVEAKTVKMIRFSILCIQPNLGPVGKALVQQGIRIDTLNWLGGFDVGLIVQIRNYIKVNKIDVVHCHQYTPWVYGAFSSAFTDVTVIFTEHGRFHPDSTSWKRRIINPILVKCTKSITAISEATKKALVEFEFIPDRRIEVIYNGIKPLISNDTIMTSLRAKYGIPPNSKIIGTVARLDPIKNQAMMLNAFAKIRRSFTDVYLLIIGDGEERKTLENLSEKLGIQHCVVFTGYESEPGNHIALMDIFLLSSLSEGTSMTLLEAMSLAKPCVVTNAGGNPEIVKHGKNGYVTENNNTSDFAAAILKLLRDPEKTRKLGISSQSRFFNLFTSKLMNEKITRIYESC